MSRTKAESGARPGQATAEALGLMAGVPPFSAECQVTLGNWQDPPFSRWSFQHVRELIPTARIARGGDPVWRLPRDERDVSKVSFRHEGRRFTIGRMLDETWTDAFLVLHRGRIVTEHYRNGMSPETTHLLMSVTKSVASTIAGILIGRGLLDPQARVTDVVAELSGTSFEGATVQHLLDMRAGTKFDEDYDNPKADVRIYEQVYLWRPRSSRRLPDNAHAYFASLKNDGPHGGLFRYRSILTDVLGWVIEKAGGARLADLIAAELWQPMGAEFDAEITVDGLGNAMADGGLCATLRDMGRFGQLFLQGGRRGRRRIVPAAWIMDIVESSADGAEAFEPERRERKFPRRAHYRNQWWVYDPAVPFYFASGIHGQNVFVHVPAQTVVVKFSTWPEASHPARRDLTIAAAIALAEAACAS